MTYWQALRLAFLRQPVWGTALALSVLASVYWLVVASDRYVSESHVIVQRTDMAAGTSVDLSSLMSGMAGGNRADQLLLRTHLRSVDMLLNLDGQLNLKTHYSQWQRDPLSRMWSSNPDVEMFHRHFLSRVSIELDEFTGVLIIRVQGYTPELAQALNERLVSEGERFMNHMAHQLAQAQVGFLESQVKTLSARAQQSRQLLLSFQDQKGLAAPKAMADGVQGIVNQLQAQRSELQTQRGALQAYLVNDHPSIVMLNQQIQSIERQIAQEQSRLASPQGMPLNRTLEAFAELERQALFDQEVYQSALTSLERGRIEATRTIKKVSVLQAPSLPEYPMEPRRVYNTSAFFLIAFLLAGVVQLLREIVRDHQD
jgi:capsular polysaccharide transport system permease protein